MALPGDIIALEGGVTVVLTVFHRRERDTSRGWFSGVIIASTDPHYRVGGNDLAIAQSDIEKAKQVILDNDTIAALTADMPLIGPSPTIEDFASNIRERVAARESAEAGTR